MHRRESSFELLRLVLMFLIIIHHSIVHGMGLSGLAWEKTLPMHFSEWEKPVATIVNCLCICAVNCFVLISGYFSIKFNIKKLISLLITVVIYTFFLCTVYNLAIGNIKGAISRMMIFSHPTYWFVNTYIYLTVFAPLINLMFEKMSKRYQIFFIASLLFISCYLGFIWLNPLNPHGYNLIQFILMYSIGRFISYYPLKISKIASFILYLVPSVITGVFMFLLWHTGHTGRSWQMTGYNNPLIMLAAIGLFMFFSKIRFKSNIINKWASSAFAIYMVQSSLLSNVLYYKLINWLHIEMGGGIWLIVIVLAFAVMAISIIIDQVQKPVSRYITEKMLLTVNMVIFELDKIGIS